MDLTTSKLRRTASEAKQFSYHSGYSGYNYTPFLVLFLLSWRNSLAFYPTFIAGSLIIFEIRTKAWQEGWRRRRKGQDGADSDSEHLLTVPKSWTTRKSKPTPVVLLHYCNGFSNTKSISIVKGMGTAVVVISKHPVRYRPWPENYRL